MWLVLPHRALRSQRPALVLILCCLHLIILNSFILEPVFYKWSPMGCRPCMWIEQIHVRNVFIIPGHSICKQPSRSPLGTELQRIRHEWGFSETQSELRGSTLWKPWDHRVSAECGWIKTEIKIGILALCRVSTVLVRMKYKQIQQLWNANYVILVIPRVS